MARPGYGDELRGLGARVFLNVGGEPFVHFPAHCEELCWKVVNDAHASDAPQPSALEAEDELKLLREIADKLTSPSRPASGTKGRRASAPYPRGAFNDAARSLLRREDKREIARKTGIGRKRIDKIEVWLNPPSGGAVYELESAPLDRERGRSPPLEVSALASRGGADPFCANPVRRLFACEPSKGVTHGNGGPELKRAPGRPYLRSDRMPILEHAGDTLDLDGARGKLPRLLVAIELEGDSAHLPGAPGSVAARLRRARVARRRSAAAARRARRPGGAGSMTFEVRLQPSTCFVRWRCALCGGQTEKDGVDARFRDEHGDHHDVCWQCLQAGPEEVPARLLVQAERVEAWACALRRWAEASWTLPPYAEYHRVAEKACGIYLGEPVKRSRRVRARDPSSSDCELQPARRHLWGRAPRRPDQVAGLVVERERARRPRRARRAARRARGLHPPLRRPRRGAGDRGRALGRAHAGRSRPRYATPYLFVTSAEPESGKTRLLEVLQRARPRAALDHEHQRRGPLPRDRRRSSRRSSSTRSTRSSRSARRSAGSKDDLRALLNAGYRRGQAVYRMGGGNHTTLRELRGLRREGARRARLAAADAASRCLPIELKRRRMTEPVEDFFPRTSPRRPSACAQWLESWAATMIDTLRAASRTASRAPRPHDGGLAPAARDRRARRRGVGGPRAPRGARLWQATTTSLARAAPARRHPRRLRGARGAGSPTADLILALARLEESPWGEWWIDKDDEPSRARRAASRNCSGPTGSARTRPCASTTRREGLQARGLP